MKLCVIVCPFIHGLVCREPAAACSIEQFATVFRRVDEGCPLLAVEVECGECGRVVHFGFLQSEDGELCAALVEDDEHGVLLIALLEVVELGAAQ